MRTINKLLNPHTMLGPAFNAQKQLKDFSKISLICCFSDDAIIIMLVHHAMLYQIPCQLSSRPNMCHVIFFFDIYIITLLLGDSSTKTDAQYSVMQFLDLDMTGKV